MKYFKQINKHNYGEETFYLRSDDNGYNLHILVDGDWVHCKLSSSVDNHLSLLEQPDKQIWTEIPEVEIDKILMMDELVK